MGLGFVRACRRGLRRLDGALASLGRWLEARRGVVADDVDLDGPRVVEALRAYREDALERVSCVVCGRRLGDPIPLCAECESSPEVHA